MKIASTHLLVVASLAAFTGLVALWIDQDGQLRDIAWKAPAPVTADLGVHPYFRLNSGAIPDPGIFLATLDRPLFAPDRKQPPPPPPPAPPPAPDSLAGARLLGVVSGTSGAVLVHADGRVRRLIINQSIGEWSLKSVDSREATFQRNDETRVVRMGYASLKVQVEDAAAKTPASTSMPTAQTDNYKRQLKEDEERERRVAELRARMSAISGQK
jgi:hypothetical protein